MSTPSGSVSQHDGGYAEYLLVPHERYLVRLTTLETKAAAPLTDAALTPYRAVTRGLRDTRPDYPMLVIGCGALGQFGIKILRLLCGADIIAVDLDDKKLATARAAGATHTLNGRDADIARKILELARGVGVSAAFDFVGAESTLKLGGWQRACGRTGRPGETRRRHGAHDRADREARGRLLHVLVGEHSRAARGPRTG